MFHHLTRVWALPLLTLICAVSGSAATFNFSAGCAALSIGPDTIAALPSSLNSGSVILTPNVPDTTDAFIPTDFQTTIVRNNSTATFNGTLSCTVTFGGVSTNITRAVTLSITVPGPGTSQEQHAFSFSAVSFTLDLGAQGKVDISAPVSFGAGVFPQGSVANQFTLFVPFTADTILLHDVPGAPAPTPLPPSLILTLTGMAGIGLYRVRRQFARAN